MTKKMDLILNVLKVEDVSQNYVNWFSDSKVISFVNLKD